MALLSPGLVPGSQDWDLYFSTLFVQPCSVGSGADSSNLPTTQIPLTSENTSLLKAEPSPEKGFGFAFDTSQRLKWILLELGIKIPS